MRRGEDENGRPWAVRLAYDYGYIKRTEGADGEQVDVFLGPNLTSGRVFVVNQDRQDGRFDEHKVMIGFDTAAQAESAYLENYSPGWDRYRGAPVEMSVDQLKAWLKDGDLSKPARPMGMRVVLSTGDSVVVPQNARERMAAAEARIKRLEALRRCIGA